MICVYLSPRVTVRGRLRSSANSFSARFVIIYLGVHRLAQ
jgi:hypothetical protein